MKSPPSEEVAAAGTTCDEVATAPIPVPLQCCGEGGRELGNEVEPGEKGGVGGMFFKIWVYFSSPRSDWISNKYN